MDDKLAGVLMLLAAIAGFGGNIILSSEQQENAYYCAATGQVGVFYGGLSSTRLTAYPYKENRTGYVRCSSLWEPLSGMIQPEPQSNSQAASRYSCTVNGCDRIE